MGTTTVGSLPAVPAGDANEAGSFVAVVATGWVVLVTGVVDVLLMELEQALRPSDATRAPAARSAACFFMAWSWSLVLSR